MRKLLPALLTLCAAVLLGCQGDGNSNICSYNGQSHQPGDSFPAPDGCNTCNCASDGQIVCTKIACLGDGGVSHGGDGGDGVMCTGAMTAFPTFDKACADVSQCSFGLHQTNCCGAQLAIGFNKQEQARFDADETQCRAQYPACGCPAAPTATEDGQYQIGDRIVIVQCTGNRCMTTLQ